MRLLYLSADPGVPVLGHKGASVHVREIARALAAAGASVTIASPRVEPEGDVLESSIELHSISPVLPKMFTTTAELRAAMASQVDQVIELARRIGAHAIYERHSLFSCAGVEAAEALGLPHVLEVNAPLRVESLRFRSLPHAELADEIEAYVYAATQRIFVVSNRLAQLVRDQGVESAKIEVAPNGVVSCPAPPRSSDAKRPLTVGFAGGVKPWHGVELLVSAFRTVLQTGVDIRLEIIAAGSLDGARDVVEPPDDRLVRLGPLPHTDTLRRVSGWDVGVAPYLPMPDFYFSPLKILEYMALGLCPVASDLGEIGALLGGGERGVLVAPGDVDALATALLALARDRERVRRLGARARAHVIANCRWDDNAERVLAALHSASRAVVA
jgi:glycosyltransferase involved in cell wall biosynthesis